MRTKVTASPFDTPHVYQLVILRRYGCARRRHVTFIVLTPLTDTLPKPVSWYIQQSFASKSGHLTSQLIRRRWRYSQSVSTARSKLSWGLSLRLGHGTDCGVGVPRRSRRLPSVERLRIAALLHLLTESCRDRSSQTVHHGKGGCEAIDSASTRCIGHFPSSVSVSTYVGKREEEVMTDWKELASLNVSSPCAFPERVCTRPISSNSSVTPIVPSFLFSINLQTRTWASP